MSWNILGELPGGFCVMDCCKDWLAMLYRGEASRFEENDQA
jgi:hypothetical protein